MRFVRKVIQLMCFWLSLAILIASTICLLVVVVISATNSVMNLLFWAYCIPFGLVIGAIVGGLATGLNALITRTANALPIGFGSIGGVVGIGLGTSFAEILLKKINQSQAMSALAGFGSMIEALVLGSIVGAILGSVCGLTKPQNFLRRNR